MYFIAHQLLADRLISQLACAYFVKVGSAVSSCPARPVGYIRSTHTHPLRFCQLQVCTCVISVAGAYVRDRAVPEVCLGTVVVYHHGIPLPGAMVNQDSLIAFPPSPQSACLWCTLAVTCPHMPTLCTYSCL